MAAANDISMDTAVATVLSELHGIFTLKRTKTNTESFSVVFFVISLNVFAVLTSDSLWLEFS